jgi:hypothetical protein
MTFELVRIGWPNTAAVLALALLPFIAFTAVPEPLMQGAAVEHTDAVSCPMPSAHGLILAAVANGIPQQPDAAPP